MQNSMSNLRLLSNDSLLTQTRTLVVEERKLTTRILWHLREIEDRRLFAERGYPSLFEMCVREFNYSEATAGRRIAAMRLLRELPELEKKLESGELKIGQVSQIQGFLRAEKRDQGKGYSLQEKRDLIARIEGKSTRETERELISISPQSAGVKERERAISVTETEIRFIADEKLLKKMKRLQELGAHRFGPERRYVDLINWLVDLGLAKLDPESVKAEKKPTSVGPAPEKALSVVATRKSGNSTHEAQTQETPLSALKPSSSLKDSTLPKPSRTRTIPAAIKRQVWLRDQGCCTFVDSRSGRKCESRTLIQIDHIHPFALGGRSDDPTNLRLLCFQHNQLEADRWFQTG